MKIKVSCLQTIIEYIKQGCGPIRFMSIDFTMHEMWKMWNKYGILMQPFYKIYQ